jgi:hypothetical protein
MGNGGGVKRGSWDVPGAIVYARITEGKCGFLGKMREEFVHRFLRRIMCVFSIKCWSCEVVWSLEILWGSCFIDRRPASGFGHTSVMVY